MEILDGFKLCRKGLHQYSIEFRQCPECQKEWYQKNKEKNRRNSLKWRNKNLDKARESKRQWAKNNSDRVRNYQNNWRSLNEDRERQSKKKWKELNKERYAEARRKWSEANTEKIKTYAKNTYLRNKHKMIARAAKRRRKLKQAMPHWANVEAIYKIYEECRLITEKTGIKHEVDHIYPIHSKWLCGLHVETNLQIITKKENRLKSNKTWPGQLDCQKSDPHLVLNC